MPFRILSIDGGGIRGLVPALVLADLERRTGRHCSELFDLIAGTSTGGILALGLTRPGPDGRPAYTAQDLVRLYREQGSAIFDRSLWHRILAVGNVAEEKYPNHGIESVLADRFGDTMLSQALTPVLVTSYDIEACQPYFFKSHRARGDRTRDHLMREAARATSAAPTYFEPARVADAPGEAHRALVDGGVFANNPAACALVEAICEFGAPLNDVVLLSLGTGQMTRSIPYDEARDWGLARWAQPLLNVVFDGVSDTVDHQLVSLLAQGGSGRYLRIQSSLDAGNDSLDDAGDANLDALAAFARRLIDQNGAALDGMAARLVPTGVGAPPAAADLPLPPPEKGGGPGEVQPLH